MTPVPNMDSASVLKEQVRAYWNEQSCDTQVARAEARSRQYFQQIEDFRYYDQPFIHSFAQFTRYYRKRVLEVGFGAGTDFIQWLRAGAIATGVDLTQEALDNVRARIDRYGLPQPEQIATGDAEHLSFSDNTFDLGYSFGVLHHTPDTEKAIKELVRVIKPGGELKIMLYNRRSIFIFNRWVRFALLKGRPWKTLRWVLWHHNESVGTKGYTRRELQTILQALPLENIHIHTQIMAGDWLSSSALKPLNWLYRLAIAGAGYSYPWRPEHYVARINDGDASSARRKPEASPDKVIISGNPLGFFHCISAHKVT